MAPKLSQADIPTRHESMQRAREQGLRLIAALPYQVPRALLRAHGFHAIEVWAPPQVAADSGARHFQAYACSIVVHGAAFLIDVGFDEVDAVLVPHGCDALQGLGSVLGDFVGDRPPILTLYPPRARRPVDADYLAAELEALGAKLSAISGRTPDAEAWAAALAAEEAADSAYADFHARRAAVALTDREFHAVLRAREYLLPEDFVALVAAQPEGAPARPGVQVLLSGIVADPLDLLDVLNSAGAHVVADDLGSGSRRILPESSESDPYRRIADRIIRGPIDPTRTDSMGSRVDYLKAMVHQSGAAGVVVFDPTFCEPEQFYLPALRKRLGVPLLFLEHEAVTGIDGQTVNRIEAFVETLSLTGARP